MTKLTNPNQDQRHKYHHLMKTFHWPLRMPTIQTVDNKNFLSEDYSHPHDHTRQTDAESNWSSAKIKTNSVTKADTCSEKRKDYVKIFLLLADFAIVIVDTTNLEWQSFQHWLRVATKCYHGHLLSVAIFFFILTGHQKSMRLEFHILILQ